jgi:hypothetical protein
VLTKESLTQFLNDQNEILVDLNISTKNLMRLKVDKYEYEKQIKLHGFSQHHWYQLKFIVVVQLAKLFSSRDTDKRSFTKLCSKIETSPYDDSLLSLLATNKAKSLPIAYTREDLILITKRSLDRINANEELITRILTARDNVYAHKGTNVVVKYIKSEEILSIVSLANEIYNDFTYNIFHDTWYLDHATGWDIDYREPLTTPFLILNRPFGSVSILHLVFLSLPASFH